MPKRVVHIITGLGKGGAETTLYELLARSSVPTDEQCVISLGKPAYFEPLIQGLGIQALSCNAKSNPMRAFWQAYRVAQGAEVICCWMYHANFFGYYLSRLVRPKRLIWQIRHSNLDPTYNSRTTLLINKACARRSSNVSAIVYNGECARLVHEAAGYSREKGIVLVNGCDCAIYRPDPKKRQTFRSELGLSDNVRVILSVGRYHPIKDVPNFIRAFAEVRLKHPDCVAVMCGDGYESTNSELVELAISNGLTLGKDLHLLGRRDNLPEIMAGSDLYVLHSASEAFPNSLIQAMACGLVCVATDVGDVRSIMGSDTFIVEPNDSGLLSKRMGYAIDVPLAEYQFIQHSNRDRVMKAFSLDAVVSLYESVLLQV